jgi:hypothetical protein
VDAIVDSTIVADGTPWDGAAFRSGVRAAAETDGTLPGLMTLTGRNLPAHHMALVQRQLGVPFLGNMVSRK